MFQSPPTSYVRLSIDFCILPRLQPASATGAAVAAHVGTAHVATVAAHVAHARHAWVYTGESSCLGC